MTEFEYLAAFISIVAGLGVAQTLSGITRLIHGRRTMVVDYVHLFWTASLLIWLIVFWWFSFSLSGVESWSIGHLLFVLSYPALIYLLLALLYPTEMPQDFNTRDHIDANRAWIFLTLLCLGGIELTDAWYKGKSGLLPGNPGGLGPTAWYPGMMAIWMIGSAVAAWWSNRRFDQIFAAVFLLLSIAMLLVQGTLPEVES